MRIVDFDNDGRDDILMFYSGQANGPDDQTHGVQLYRWTDTGFVRESLGGLRLADMPCGQAGTGPNRCYDWTGTQPLDVNGDGLLDLVNFTPGGKQARLFIRRGGMPDQLVGIEGGLGTQRVEIGYTTLADRSVHTPGSSCGYPLICPASGGSIVAWHRIATEETTGANPWDRYDHRYQAARVDLRGVGWLGFAEHTVIRQLTREVTVTNFDNMTSVNVPNAEYARAVVYPYAGVATSVTTQGRDEPGNIFQPDNIFQQHRRAVTYRNAIQQNDDGSFFTYHWYITETEEEIGYQGIGWQTLRQTKTQTHYDEFGNRDRVLSATVGGRSLAGRVDYNNNTGTWLIGQPRRTVVTGCTATNVCTTRESTFHYDDRGNPTVTVVEPNTPELTLTSTTAYGPLGVVASVTRADGEGHIRRDIYEYDADQLYPTAMVDAMGHRTVIDTYSGLGVALSVTDPNGVPTTMRYDWFGRLRETNYADGYFEHVSHLSFFGIEVVTITDAGGGNTEMMFDRRGREIERIVASFDGRDARTLTHYDALGRTDRVSRPALSGEQELYAQFRYDLRGRVTSVTAPDGAQVRHQYRGRETHTYDAKNVHSYTLQTADGDVESSYEHDPNSAEWLRTRFEYGPFGEPTKIVAPHPDGTTQTMYYDPLGRRVRLQDPSSGTTITTYNAFGEVATETDAENRTTTFEYDALGRVKKETSPDGVATNTWDTADHGRGKLAETRSADGVTTGYTYDELSKNATTTWTIEGTRYEFKSGYDNIGRLACLTYPEIPGTADRLSVGYSNNSRGYLAQVTDGCQIGARPYWTAEARNAAGQLQRERLGNGVVTTRTYQPATGLLDRISTTGPDTGGSLSDIAYTYDANRNVTQRNDLTHQRAETYGYDDLNRLTGWSVHNTEPTTPGLNATYAYDTVGNLKTETVQAATQPEQDITYRYGEHGDPPHALTSRNNDQYIYNPAGQQTSGPNRTVQYNTFGLPTVIDWRTGQGQFRHTTFTYDSGGARVVKRDDEQATITIAGLYERRTPAGAGLNQIHNLHNIIVEGRVVAQVNRAQTASGGPVIPNEVTVTYLHTDLQGSTIALTNSNGQLSDDASLRDQFYDPFGRRITIHNEPVEANNRVGPRQGYTGHDHDTELDLINMNGRIYDPEARRFLTPDPILQNPLASQGRNRYTYVFNNPSTLIDPTGLQCEGDPNCPEEGGFDPVPGGGGGGGGSGGGGDWDCGEPGCHPGGGSSGGGSGSSGGSGENRQFGSNVPTPNGIDDDVARPQQGGTTNVVPPDPGWIDQAADWLSHVVEGGHSPKAAARLASLGPDQSIMRSILERGWGCTACHLSSRVWGIYGPAAFNPVNDLPYDWVFSTSGLEDWISDSSRARFLVESMTMVSVASFQRTFVAAEGEGAGLSEAFHYTRAQNVASIESKGLLPGSYATPNGGLSPLQAQIDLALPPNRGLPGSMIRIDLDGLRAAGYDIPGVSRVGRSFNMPGGGFEMQFPYAIPPEFLKVITP